MASVYGIDFIYTNKWRILTWIRIDCQKGKQTLTLAWNIKWDNTEMLCQSVVICCLSAHVYTFMDVQVFYMYMKHGNECIIIMKYYKWTWAVFFSFDLPAELSWPGIVDLWILVISLSCRSLTTQYLYLLLLVFCLFFLCKRVKTIFICMNYASWL